MKLDKMLDLIPEPQHIRLICGDLELYGDKGSLSCMLNQDVLGLTVDNIEAHNNEMKI